MSHNKRWSEEATTAPRVFEKNICTAAKTGSKRLKQAKTLFPKVKPCHAVQGQGGTAYPSTKNFKYYSLGPSSYTLNPKP